MSVLEAPVRPDAQARPKEIDLYESAVRQFDIAADILDLEDGMRKILSRCQRELIVNFPVEMDDGSVEVETLMIEGSEFVSKDDEEADEDEEKPVIPNSAVTVAHGHLIIATHVDYIKQILVEKSEPLASSPDYEAVTKALLELGADEDSFRMFTRTDEAYRATYELIRQGKMPESETMFGKLLNKMLGPDEDGVLREQEIDGSKMPEFETMVKYLGAAGAYVRSQDDGWLIVGCLLKK